MDEKKNEIILFENQGVKLEVNLHEETVWLTHEQMSVLFDTARSFIAYHIGKIFKEEERKKVLLSKFSKEVKIQHLGRQCNIIWM